jgi:hypothetical protein
MSTLPDLLAHAPKKAVANAPPAPLISSLRVAMAPIALPLEFRLRHRPRGAEDRTQQAVGQLQCAFGRV